MGRQRLPSIWLSARVGNIMLVLAHPSSTRPSPCCSSAWLAAAAGVLNLFGGVLLYKRKAEEALEASGLPYVIVRPGGMERPRDDFKESNNVRLATRDKLFGGQVSRLQVAELVAAAAASPELAENKVLEVVAEPTARPLSYEELLEEHPAGEAVHSAGWLGAVNGCC
jgi:hypothetical protein